MAEQIKDINDIAKNLQDNQPKGKSRMKKAAKAVAKSVSAPVRQKDNWAFSVDNFRSFKVLGETESGDLALYSTAKRKIYIFPVDRFRLDHLDLVGGAEIAARVVRSIKDLVTAGQIPFRALKRSIIVQAGQQQLRTGLVGTGVNLLPSGKLFILAGRSGALYDGERLERVDSPVVDGCLINVDSSEPWIEMEKLAERLQGMNKEKGLSVLERLRQFFSQWKFQGSFVPEILSGFLAGQVCQSVWSWRPNLWISGKAASGKTLLLEGMERILGSLALRLEGTSLTAAGLRQALSGTFRVPIIDEAEAGEHREGILEYLRSTGRGGTLVKGTPGQKPVLFRVRHMFTLASVEVSLARESERGRFICLETSKDDGCKPRMLSLADAEELRTDLVAFSLWAAFRVNDLLRTFDGLEGFDSRLALGYALPVAIWALVEDEPGESLRQNLENVLLDREVDFTDELRADEVCLLDDLLASVIRVPVTDPVSGDRTYQDRTVAQLLQDYSVYKEVLQSYGIKRLSNGKGVFFASQIVGRRLLRDTKWRDLNLTALLKRLPSCSRAHQRLGGRLYKGVVITDLRVVLSEEDPNGQD